MSGVAFGARSSAIGFRSRGSAGVYMLDVGQLGG